MADIRQAFILTVQGDKAVLTLAQNVETAGKKTQNLTDRFAHASTTSGKFADAVGKVSTTMARSAGLFGLNADALRAMDDAADVAELGLKNLTQTSVGFNAATLGVAAAAGALGYALGTLAREHIPGVSEAADNAVGALVRLFTSMEDLDRQANAMKGLVAFQDKMAASHAEAQAKQVAFLKASGQSTAEVIDFLEGKRRTSSDKIIDKLKEQEKAEKATGEAAKKAAAEAERAAEKWIASAERARAEWDKFHKHLVEGTEAAARDIQKILGDRALARGAGGIEEMFGPGGVFSGEEFGPPGELITSGRLAGDAFRDGFDQAMEQLPDVILGALQGGGDVARSIGALFGSELGKELGTHLASSIGGTLGKVLGGALPGIGGIVGSLAGGLIDKIFGPSAVEQLNDIRDAWFETQGGFVSVQEKLSGLTSQDLVKKIFDADTVAEFNAAVGEVMGLFGLQTEANEKLNEAVERYGFTIDQLGPKWKQQELDKMAAGLLQDYKLLVASGIDNNLVIEKMAPAMNEYVQTALAAGVAIPEAMRPQIEKMLEMGLLTDQSGKAYENLEETGITFTENLTESMSKLVDKIDDLVSALLGIPNVRRTIEIETVHTGGGGGGNGGGNGGSGGGGHQPNFSSGGGGGMNIQLNIDGHALAHWVTEASQKGNLRIHPSAVSKAGF